MKTLKKPQFTKTTLVILLSSLLFACGDNNQHSCCTTNAENKKLSNINTQAVTANDRDGDGIENNKDAEPDNRQITGYVTLYDLKTNQPKDLKLGFDAQGRETYRKDLGRLLEKRYDTNGNLSYEFKKSEYSTTKKHHKYNNNIIKSSRVEEEYKGNKRIHMLTYDESGNIIQENKDSNADGTIDTITKHTITKHPNGKTKRTLETTTENDKITFITETVYDENGNIIKYETKNADGHIKGEIKRYDTKKREVYYAFYYQSKDVKTGLTEIKEKKYDDKDNLVYESFDKDGDGTPEDVSKTSIEYDAKGKILIQSESYNGITSRVTKNIYSNNNLIKTTIDSNGDGEIDKTIEYGYDDNKNIIKNKQTGKDSYNSFEIDYEYDQKNRVISKTNQTNNELCKFNINYDDANLTEIKKIDTDGDTAIEIIQTEVYADNDKKIKTLYELDNNADGTFEEQTKRNKYGQLLKEISRNESGKIYYSYEYKYQGTVTKEAKVNGSKDGKFNGSRENTLSCNIHYDS